MTRPASERPVYELVLRPEASCGDPIIALRAALKRLLRDHALRCLSVRQVQRDEPAPGHMPGGHPVPERESGPGSDR